MSNKRPGRHAKGSNTRMRDLALTAVALKLCGAKPEAIVIEIVAEARRRGLAGGYSARHGHSLAAVFPNEGRIDWDGRVWAFVPEVPEE